MLELGDDEGSAQALAHTVASARCLHVRISAATALSELNGLPGELLGDLAGAGEERFRACVAHAAEGDGECARLAELALGDPERRVREAAIEALAASEDGDEALARVARESDERALVLSAVRALASHAAAAALLAELVVHPDVEVGLAAFAAMRRAPRATRACAARRLLERSDERAAILALVALAEVGGAGDLARIAERVRTSAGRVRAAALEAQASLAGAPGSATSAL